MIKSVLFFLLSFFVIVSAASANYTTPGTGVRFTLDNLVANSAGDVIFTAGAYNVNDTITISLNDTLIIISDATVKFAAGTLMDVNGTITVNPPTGVLFTAQNTTTGYLGVRLNASTASVLKKLTFEYAVSLKLSDCSIAIDSCTFQYNNNNTSTSFGNGAIAVFRANPVITNSRFLNNQRAAIQGGSNINNAPKIINCLFMGNNITNSNVPQINLGTSGSDTVKIINCQLLRSSTNSGAIGFLPIGNVYALITGNVIKNNRYGITFNGGSNINSMVSYNVIDSNNTQGDGNLGGSGISYSGGTSTSHQNSVVTGNYIRWNLWGITIGSTTTGGGAMPNLGNLTNTDTSDNGKNRIYGNTNTGTPFIDLYNNNVDNIFAQNNYWGTDNIDTIEAHIFHKPDNNALGTVNYSVYLTLPVALTSFTASPSANAVTLNWTTALENNSDYFSIEKSDDGHTFYIIGKVTAAGTSAFSRQYNFTDKTISNHSPVFYRLQQVDKDNTSKYSAAVLVKWNDEKANAVKLYPTVVTASQTLHAEVISPKAQRISIRFIDNEGRQVGETSKELVAGINVFPLLPGVSLPNGLLRVRFTGGGLDSSVGIIKQ